MAFKKVKPLPLTDLERLFSMSPYKFGIIQMYNPNYMMSPIIFFYHLN